MEARELRIGNYIKIHNTITKVEGLSTWDNIIQNSDFAERELKEFQPIPLTEEWLLKFGFKKELDSFYRIKNSYLLEVLFHDKGFTITTQSVCLNHINYLHQLQNLYFALTGAELTLNK